MKRIIFCGSRDWTDGAMIRRAMRALAGGVGEPIERYTVIHGDARGADRLVDFIGSGMGFEVEPFPADWLNRPRWAAGPERNQRMLDAGADMVVAFKDGFRHVPNKGGTEDMVCRALQAGVPCVLYAHEPDAPYTFTPNANAPEAAPPGVQRRDEDGNQATLF